MKYTYSVLNNQTGEEIEVIEEARNDSFKINQAIIDSLINDFTSNKEDDELRKRLKNSLIRFLSGKKEINNLGQLKIHHIYNDIQNELYDKYTKEISAIAIYILVLFKYVSPFSHIIMKNFKTAVNNWTELYELIGITKRITQSKFKKFVSNNNLIRLAQLRNENKFIVNPFLFQSSSYCDNLALSLFKDFFKQDKNISKYSIKWLEINGY